MLTRADQLGQCPCREERELRATGRGSKHWQPRKLEGFTLLKALHCGVQLISIPQEGCSVYYRDTHGVGLTNSWVTADMEAKAAKTLQGDLSQT